MSRSNSPSTEPRPASTHPSDQAPTYVTGVFLDDEPTPDVTDLRAAIQRDGADALDTDIIDDHYRKVGYVALPTTISNVQEALDTAWRALNGFSDIPAHRSDPVDERRSIMTADLLIVEDAAFLVLPDDFEPVDASIADEIEYTD